MFRLIIVTLLTLIQPFVAAAQNSVGLNEVSIVALIVTSEGETPVSLSVTQTLESLDAQTLTANAPNASQLRSVLKRFTAAAIDTDVALVYYDGTVLRIGNREFVAPGGIELRRPSDLLTKAIPLSAFARATALAANGGAVLVHSSAQSIALINGVTLVENAPTARSGTSPILFASSSAAVRLAEGLEAMVATDGDIDLTEALRALAGLNGVSISQQPTRTTLLRKTTARMAMVTQNPVTEAASAAEGGTSMALPQVGTTTTEAVETAAAPDEATQAAAPAEPETTTTPEGAAEPEATTETAEPEMAQPEAPAPEAEPAEETAVAATDPAEPAIPEPSIEVLKANQDALSRSQKRILQRHLRNLGFYRGLIDGIFGRQSERAISAYQESIGANVTGVLNTPQLEALSE